MDRKARQRILRSFLASLIQSELSVDDLRALAIELDSGAFGHELSQIILDTIRGISTFDGGRAATGSPAGSGLDDALIAVKAKKMSKKMVMELMKVASPLLRESMIAPAMQKSLALGLKRFFEVANAEDCRIFMDILAGKSSDAYLKGINNR
ncbi:hypothetical protein [Methylosinus sporium]|uniref:Uncharacterized protein n=1 Tax=Methylosinus sporium TaxID=428 RepID=A0A2U1SUN0_METSR|nr:hypothetical protein [Methylosinus sporium]PWB95317.1 hypothetical protein C5689_04065 [Methylosinus sporium]